MDKLICVGKNYLEHAKELGDRVSEQPVLFLKPPSVKVTANKMGETIQVILPKGRGAVHHECEIVLRLDHQGNIEAVTLGLDLTLREVQTHLKKAGHPWEISKVFPHSAVIGPWVSIQEFSNYLEGEFVFKLDGQVRQRGCGKEMRFAPDKCIAYAKECFPVCSGDLIFTGTPAGVGPVMAGQAGELLWGSRLSYRVQFL